MKQTATTWNKRTKRRRKRGEKIQMMKGIKIQPDKKRIKKKKTIPSKWGGIYILRWWRTLCQSGKGGFATSSMRTEKTQKSWFTSHCSIFAAALFFLLLLLLSIFTLTLTRSMGNHRRRLLALQSIRQLRDANYIANSHLLELFFMSHSLIHLFYFFVATFFLFFSDCFVVNQCCETNDGTRRNWRVWRSTSVVCPITFWPVDQSIFQS